MGVGRRATPVGGELGEGSVSPDSEREEKACDTRGGVDSVSPNSEWGEKGCNTLLSYV